MGRRVSGVRSPGKQQGSGIAEPGTGTDRIRRPEHGRHCKDLTKGDSVTGSNICDMHTHIRQGEDGTGNP